MYMYFDWLHNKYYVTARGLAWGKYKLNNFTYRRTLIADPYAHMMNKLESQTTSTHK